MEDMQGTNGTTPDLSDAAAQVAGLVDGIGEEQLPWRTPCGHYRVEDVLAHLMGLTLAFRYAAEKTPAGPPPPGPVPLEAGWRTELPARLDALVAAWRRSSAWEGEAEAGGVTMPAEMMGRVALNEVVLHGWDVARATGLPYEVGERTVELILPFLEASAEETGGKGTEGLFGPVVPVPPGAPPFDRALALAGRDPAWRP